MKEPVQMPLQASACEIEKITLPQIVSIKQASEIMNLPPYYLRRVCRENPDLAFQSGVKWYICSWMTIPWVLSGMICTLNFGRATILPKQCRSI